MMLSLQRITLTLEFIQRGGGGGVTSVYFHSLIASVKSLIYSDLLDDNYSEFIHRSFETLIEQAF